MTKAAYAFIGMGVASTVAVIFAVLPVRAITRSNAPGVNAAAVATPVANVANAGRAPAQPRSGTGGQAPPRLTSSAASHRMQPKGAREFSWSPAAPSTRPQAHRISDDLLARLIATCAPQVDPRTQAAIVTVESGGDAWALHDDNDDSHFAPDSYDDAVALARLLIDRDCTTYGTADRGVDVGLAQINSANFPGLHVDAEAMFDPCRNLRASAKIISTAYVQERAGLGNVPGVAGDQLALQRALQVYNSGKNNGDDTYVRAIIGALDAPLVRSIAANAERLIPSDALSQDTSENLASTPASTVAPRVERRRIAGKPSDPGTTRASSVFVHVDTDAATPDSGSAKPHAGAGGGGASFLHTSPQDASGSTSAQDDTVKSQS